MGVHKKQGGRITQIWAIFLVVLAFVVPGITLALPATAAVEDPKITATIQMTSSGTGYCDPGVSPCPTQSFVNSANGFTPGADSASGGVVASSDYVSYLSTVVIGAGPARTVEVVYGFPEWLSFDPSQNPNLCISNLAVKGTLLTTEPGSQAVCSYEAQAWQPATVQSTLFATADDTAGTVQNGQVVSVSTRVPGNEYFATVNAKAVTVVSAPAADLVLRPDQCTIAGQCQALDASVSESTLHVMVMPLAYPGWSKNGASTATQWSGSVDVSAFPEGTEWFLREVDADPSTRTPLTITDGKVQIPKRSGPVELDYVTPVVNDDDGDADVQEAWGGSAAFPGGATKNFVAHIIPDPGAFDTPDFKNNGTGWEPGEGKPQDFNTLNQEGTGAREGYMTPNNDYTISQVFKPQPGCKQQPEQCFFGKELYRPWDTSQTLWENGNQQFKSADVPDGGNAVWVSAGTSTLPNTQGVTAGTQVQARLIINTEKIPEPTAPNDSPLFVASDQWNPEEQEVTGPIKVIGPGGVEVTEGFTVQWSRTNGGAFNNDLCGAAAGGTCGFDSSVADPTDSAGWVTTPTPPAGARAVRVIFDNPSLPIDGAEGSGNFYVAVPMQVLDFEALDPIPAQSVDKSYFWYNGNIAAPPQKQVAPVQTPIPTVGVEITAEPSDTIDPETYQVTYTVDPTITNLISSKLPVSGKITMSIDPCVTDVSLLSEEWEVVSVDYGTGCGLTDEQGNPVSTTRGTIVLQPKAPTSCPAGSDCPAGSWIPSTMKDGVAALPPIDLLATVSRLKVGDAAASVEWTLTDRETTNTTATDSVTINVPAKGEINEILLAKTPVQQINDPLVWQAVVQGAKIDTDPESGELLPAQSLGTATVIALPTLNAAKNNEYAADYEEANAGVVFGGVSQSDYQGDYHLVSAAVVPEDSVDETSLFCTTVADPVLDPTVDQSWIAAPVVDGVQTCTDPGTTAIKVEQAKGSHLGISTVDITLQPVGNQMGDVYVMWIGPQQLGDGSPGNPVVVGAMAPPKEERIVSSDVTGAVYWDQSGIGTDFAPGTPLVDGVVVTLCMVGNGSDQTKQVQASAAAGADPAGSDCNAGDTKIAVTTTVGADEGDEPDYNYQFTGLHTGDYYTIISGYPTQVASKVNPSRQIDVEQTRSYKGQVLDNAKPVSTTFSVPEGSYNAASNSFTAGVLPDVNFGFFAPDPYSDLAKSVSAVSCPEEDPDDPTSNVCDITWQIDVVSSAVAQVPGTPVQVSSNFGNSMVVTANGDVYVTGGNTFGQLANGTQSGNYTVPTKIDALSGLGVTKVSASPSQAMFALTRYGEVYVWGINRNGQLGLGDKTVRTTPVLVEDLPPIKDIAKYGRGSFLIAKNGDVYVTSAGAPGWAMGQLGLGPNMTGSPSLKFAKIDGLSNVVSMNANEAAAYAIDSNGDLWAWGNNDLGLLAGNSPTNTNSSAACANTIHGCSPSPQKVGKFGGENVVQVAAGRHAGAAINATGQMYVWGVNDNGQLGLGNGAVGTLCDYHPYGLDETKTAFCAKTPQLMPPPADGGTWAQVQMGWVSGLAMSSKGNLYSWGGSTWDVLGTGATTTQWTPVQVNLPDGLEPKSISLRSWTPVVLTTDNQVLSWGLNTNQSASDSPPAGGAVGNGTTGDVPTPVLMDPTWVTGSMTYDYANSLGSNQTLTGGTLTDTTSQQVYDVQAFIGKPVKSVATGPGTSLFTVNTGQVYQAGSNLNAQAGNGTSSAGQNEPVLGGWQAANGVQGKIVQQVLTNGQAYTVTDAGNVYVTGTNQYGRWGLGQTEDINAKKLSPTLIDTFPAGTKIKQVAANEVTTYALTTNGEVYAWGQNLRGSMGNGQAGSTSDNYTSPQKIDGLSNIGSIAAGQTHAFAISNDGSVYGWGGNHFGRVLGYCKPNDPSCLDGTKQTVPTPTLINTEYPELPPLVEIAAGGFHTVGRSVDGRLYAWGSNGLGNQGNGLGTDDGGALPCNASAAATNLVFPPHQLTGLPPMSSVVAGYRNTLALSKDGQVYTWGTNDFGELGRDISASGLSCTSTPGPIPTISGATAIASENEAADTSGAFAVVSGNVLAWGPNTIGKLGIGTSIDPVPVPTPVVDTWNSQKITLTVKEITHSNGWVERVYEMPDIDPGDSVTVTVTGKVNRPGPGAPGGPMTGYTIGNQAYYESDQTPLDPGELPTTPSLPGDPAPEGGQPAPGQPEGHPFNPDQPFGAGKWPHDYCDATPGWVVPGDQCDAVTASVPGSQLPVGSLSGRVWGTPTGVADPANASTTYDSSRDQLFAGVTATLYVGTPTTPGTIDGLTKIGSTLTDSNGDYQFDNLLPNTGYYVVFSRPTVTDGTGAWAPAEPGTHSTAADVSVADQTYVMTPAMTVVADADTPNVDAGFWKTDAAIEVTKQGADPYDSYALKNDILVPYSPDPAPAGGTTIIARMQNTGNEPLDHLVFDDQTIAGEPVVWSICNVDGQSAPFDVSGGLPFNFPTDVRLWFPGNTAGDKGSEISQYITCQGTLPAFPGNTTNGYHEDTVTFTGTGTISGAVLQEDDTFTQVTDPTTLPVPEIVLEKGILVDANPDGSCPGEAVKQDLDDSCWQKTTLVTPGTSSSLTFRIWNTGNEDLTQVALDDQVTQGNATLTFTTLRKTKAQPVTPVQCNDSNGNPVDTLPARVGNTGSYPFVDCTANLNYVGFEHHQNVANVMATGAVTGSLVQDDSSFSATVPFFIQKIGKKNGETGPLDGALWSLEASDGTVTTIQPELCDTNSTSDACVVINASGLPGEFYALAGLPAGDYNLIETKAPDGFNLLPEPIKLTVSDTGAVTVAPGAGSLDITNGTATGYVDAQYQVVKVSDVPFLGGLPLTGGAGWVLRIFTGLAVIGVFVWVERMSRRRENATQTGK